MEYATKEEMFAQIRKTQNKLLEILVYFDSFCTEQNLHYVLAGGTCLGAVRHKGFIPWDDDVDVFMTRDEYEKLPDLWNKYANTDKYACVRSDEKVNIHHSATEIKDNNTTFINKHSIDLDINHGLMIDVIPLDDVSDSSVKWVCQKFYSLLFCCYNFQRLPDHKSKAVYYAEKFALDLVKSGKIRYFLWKSAEKRFVALGKNTKSGKVASFVEGPTIMNETFPKEWVENPVKLNFEGHEFYVMSHYDKWLEMSYGEYMKLPPEEEQIARHVTYFIDLEHSYKEYKGIKYCVKKK